MLRTGQALERGAGSGSVRANSRLALARLAVVLLGTSVSGCASTVALDHAVVEYDRTTAESVSKQLLLNIARARHNQPIHFTAISSIAATYKFSANAGVGPALTGERGGLLVPSIGGSAEENPTISISPMQGEEFMQRLLTPFQEQKLPPLPVVPADRVHRGAVWTGDHDIEVDVAERAAQWSRQELWRESAVLTAVAGGCRSRLFAWLLTLHPTAAKLYSPFAARDAGCVVRPDSKRSGWAKQSRSLARVRDERQMFQIEQAAVIKPDRTTDVTPHECRCTGRLLSP